jgi:hypothetical protein
LNGEAKIQRARLLSDDLAVAEDYEAIGNSSKIR